MQSPETSSVPPSGPVLRRGKQLAPIQTTFPPRDDVAQAIQRPPPIETIIYKTSPPAEPPTLKSRPSRAGFFGLFYRNKSSKDEVSESHADTHGDLPAVHNFASPSKEQSTVSVKPM